MALTVLEERWQGTRTRYQADYREHAPAVAGVREVRQVREHVRRYFYEVDDHTHSSQTILTLALTGPAPGGLLPGVGTPFPEDADSLLSYHSVERDEESGNHGNIEAVYTYFADPTAIAAEVQISTQYLEQAFEGAFALVDPSTLVEDFVGNPGGNYPTGTVGDPYPITASNFRPYVPPPADRIPYRNIRITKNLTPVQFAAYDDDAFAQKVNSVPYVVKGKTYPPGTVYMPGYAEYTEVFDQVSALRYYKMSWTLWQRSRGWLLILPDLGFFELLVSGDPAGGEREIRIRNKPVTVPAKLDGFGQAATPGDPTVFLYYRVRSTVDFGAAPPAGLPAGPLGA